MSDHRALTERRKTTRQRGRLLADRKRAARQLGGAPVIESFLADLDETRLGRRRLASEERTYRRLLMEFEAATAGE